MNNAARPLRTYFIHGINNPNPRLLTHSTLWMLGNICLVCLMKNSTAFFTLFHPILWKYIERHFQKRDGIILRHRALVKSKSDGLKSREPSFSWFSEFWNPEEPSFEFEYARRCEDTRKKRFIFQNSIPGIGIWRFPKDMKLWNFESFKLWNVETSEL